MEKIILYTSPTCVFCPMVKNFLDNKGVEYEEVDVTENKEAVNEIKEKTGQLGVPVIIKGEKVVIGFDQKKLNQLLEEK
ncbi:MAG: glutaredoxin family protein [Patescibacteria group bacterium]